MRLMPAAALTALLLTTACSGFGQSKLNPLNWFKRGTPEGIALLQRPEDNRALVAQVTVLKVEPYPGGAIVRATGVPQSQGWWEAELVKVETEEEGTILYEFRIFPPVEPRPAGTPFSRQVTVAESLSAIALDGVRKIVVQGASNALSSKR
jgi:hypothetical protein